MRETSRAGAWLRRSSGVTSGYCQYIMTIPEANQLRKRRQKSTPIQRWTKMSALLNCAPPRDMSAASAPEERGRARRSERREFSATLPARAKVISGCQRPAEQGQREDEQERSNSDKAQDSAMPEQGIARGRIPAKENEGSRDGEPCQARRKPRVAADFGQKTIGRLARRYPPGKNWGNRGHQYEGQKFARYPALDLEIGLARGPRTAPNEVVPRQNAQNQGCPAVKRSFLVQPEPAAKQAPAMAAQQARQQKPAHQRIAEHRYREYEEARELKPVAGRRRAASGANRLLGRERFAATFAEKRVIQGSSHGAHGDLLLSYAARFVLLFAKGARWPQHLRDRCVQRKRRIAGSGLDSNSRSRFQKSPKLSLFSAAKALLAASFAIL